jgi:hypothetical protein
MVTRMLLSVTLYVHWLSCFLFSELCYHLCSYGCTLTKEQPFDLALVVRCGSVSL